MKNQTNKKITLSLALVALLSTPAWAQSAKVADNTPKTENAPMAEVLSAVETQQFFSDMVEDFALEGYLIDFGKELPVVTIKPFDSDRFKGGEPMSLADRKAFFAKLQGELAEAGIHVDFAKNLPAVKRVASGRFGTCNDADRWSRLGGDFADDLDDDLLLLELLSRHDRRYRSLPRVGDDVSELLLELLQEKSRD